MGVTPGVTATDARVANATMAARRAATAREPAMRVVKRPASQASDYAALDRPAVQRYARAVGDGVGAAPVDEELLDIPAFLRRQAD